MKGNSMFLKQGVKINKLFMCFVCVSFPVFALSYNEIEPNNEYVNAQPISSNDTITGIISDTTLEGVKDSVDWFKIVVDAPVKLQQIYQSTAGTTFGIDICSIDSAGKLASMGAGAKATFTSTKQTSFAILHSGTYYLRIEKGSYYEYKFCFLLIPLSKQTLFEDAELNNTLQTTKLIKENVVCNNNIKFFLPVLGCYDTTDYCKIEVGEKAVFDIVCDTAPNIFTYPIEFSLVKEGSSRIL